ncbi:MarR family winged helix-turn-helix transcriptional regulator [Pseudomonas fluorescens]|uniref:Uncharacterized protein n=1 Tax=Pseudomonas fluorescens TaxID=294 RepID=A0A5E7UWQ4_PSEFL|nr:MarR family winged helix-turn-helix transcriptional regulator [Pseudomonas fluorescens]VVQ15503.1 hypothetical protein PS928_04270 [Pseudomonas fluorescens]
MEIDSREIDSLQAEASASSHSLKTLSTMLTFFYPIHYQVGMELETRMCQGKLSRQQAAIIWLIESESGADGWVRRRAIERALSSWFESSNSRVSQMLKELSSPPLKLIIQIENPASAREKLIALTEQGKAFFKSMQQAGIDYFSTYFAHLEPEELKWGIRFLQLAFIKECDHRAHESSRTQLPPSLDVSSS